MKALVEPCPDIDAALDAARTTQGPKCRVWIILRDLPAPAAERLRVALASEDRKHSQIATAMTNLGFQLRQDAVMKHRLGRCSCGSR